MPIRTKNIYDPQSDKPFKVSRTKINDFMKCPRCFYIDRRKGITPPSGPAFTINIAIDELLKREFDGYREKGQPHPIMQQSKLSMVPFIHSELDTWRSNFKGVQYHHASTNFIVTGALDDVWVTDKGELVVVDYKATSTSKELTLDTESREVFKRQLEVYQWLLRRNGFTVSNQAFILYANARKLRDRFEGMLDFDQKLLGHDGHDDWIEPVLQDMHACLNQDQPPSLSYECPQCEYLDSAAVYYAK